MRAKDGRHSGLYGPSDKPTKRFAHRWSFRYFRTDDRKCCSVTRCRSILRTVAALPYVIMSNTRSISLDDRTDRVIGALGYWSYANDSWCVSIKKISSIGQPAFICRARRNPCKIRIKKKKNHYKHQMYRFRPSVVTVPVMKNSK